jgi:hypothetical protein
MGHPRAQTLEIPTGDIGGSNGSGRSGHRHSCNRPQRPGRTTIPGWRGGVRGPTSLRTVLTPRTPHHQRHTPPADPPRRPTRRHSHQRAHHHRSRHRDHGCDVLTTQGDAGLIRVRTDPDRSENPGRGIRQRRSHWAFMRRTYRSALTSPRSRAHSQVGAPAAEAEQVGLHLAGETDEHRAGHATCRRKVKRRPASDRPRRTGVRCVGALDTPTCLGS